MSSLDNRRLFRLADGGTTHLNGWKSKLDQFKLKIKSNILAVRNEPLEQCHKYCGRLSIAGQFLKSRQDVLEDICSATANALKAGINSDQPYGLSYRKSDLDCNNIPFWPQSLWMEKRSYSSCVGLTFLPFMSHLFKAYACRMLALNPGGTILFSR